MTTNNNQIASFKNEVKVLFNVQHPSVVSGIDCCDDALLLKEDGQEIPIAFIVMERFLNGSLQDFLGYKPLGSRPDICRFYFKRILDTVRYLHKEKIAHRDLKPDNILLDNNLNVKIADFGLAGHYDWHEA